MIKMFYKPTILTFRILLGRDDNTNKASCIVIGFPEIKLEDYDITGREATGDIIPYAAIKNFKEQLTEIVKNEFRYDTDDYIKGRIRNSLLIEISDEIFDRYTDHRFGVMTIRRY